MVKNMKIVFSLIFVLISTLSHSQKMTNFELTKEGVKPVNIKLGNLGAKIIYKKTMDWVQENYSNPSAVLKSNIENKTIRIEDLKRNAWFYMGFGFKNEFDMEYSFQVDIQDNKVKLTFTPKQFWNGDEKAPFSYDLFFTNDGRVDWQWKDAKPSMDKTMNDIGLSLLSYIREDKK